MLKRLLVSVPILLLLGGIGLAQETPTITDSSVDIDRDGKLDRVVIKMISGERYDDTELWGGRGVKYESVFTITTEIAGKPPIEHNLNVLYDGKIGYRTFFFWAELWRIQFQDYNRDGQVDFNIGQYGGSNGWWYKLFTISKEGTIIALNLPGLDGVPVRDFACSTSKIKLTEAGFCAEWYDNSDRPPDTGFVRHYYRWIVEKNAFVLDRREGITN